MRLHDDDHSFASAKDAHGTCSPSFVMLIPLARHATVNLYAKSKTPLTPQRGERCLTAPAVPPSFRPARAQADAHHGTASNAIPSPLVTVECRRSLLGCRSVRASRVHSLVSARPLSHHSRLSPRRGDGYSLGHRQYEIE